MLPETPTVSAGGRAVQPYLAAMGCRHHTFTTGESSAGGYSVAAFIY
ncbi:MAG: hypothetical protein JXR85_10490 [Deltaproteobacteria bacterium]|nr:hypothetical protein [Deltaproteobacteria bacterium]